MSENLILLYNYRDISVCKVDIGVKNFIPLCEDISVAMKR